MMSNRAVSPAFAFLIAAAGLASAQTLEIVDDLPGEFIDITELGAEALHLSGDLSAEITTSIGNAVFPAGRVVVGNNGGLGFDPPVDFLAPLNEEIPSGNAFGGGQGGLVFWDDIGNDVGDPYWLELDDRVIVQWHDSHFEGSEDTARFQIQIFADVLTPQPIYAQFIYDDIEQPRPGGGASATIGYQDGGAGFNDVQWSFNTPDAVWDGAVLSVIPEPSTVVLVGFGGLTLIRRR
ncbi:MAG TPA: PEP-CTERM sorting domain-containing protein [Phycisphaerae bacterium]|nr:PEP-CTERM sorting domain-containing protein [Phycisphaerae bacterium]